MKPFVLRTPLGAFGYDPTDRHGSAQLTARQMFATRLYAEHRDKHGHLINEKTYDLVPGKGYDLGSGLVTNVGVLAMANDHAWSAQLNLSTIGLQNNHAWGTGTTAAAATDIACQTLGAPTTTTGVAGAQTLVSAANSQKYQTVATITAGSTLAITEWGLHSFLTLTASTGSPFTATTATTGTDTAAAQTASSATVRGQQQKIVYNATTDVYLLVLSNTTGVFTGPAWYKKTDGTLGSTPGNTAFTILPVLWDHKVFSAINVISGDTVQFTYQLTVSSGG